MKKERFTEEPMAFALRQAELERPIGIFRSVGGIPTARSNWRYEYGNRVGGWFNYTRVWFSNLYPGWAGDSSCIVDM